MINNKTRLNTSLETFVSSGAIDVIMLKEWSVNNPPFPLNPVREGLVPIGDRYTVFLNQLFTNYFFINLENLGEHKTIFVNFRTTREFSFSLTAGGNRTVGNHKNIKYDLVFGPETELWGRGNVRNLEKYFDGYPEDQVLEFNVMIHKANSYTYEMKLMVSENPIDYYIIKYFKGRGRHGTHVDWVKVGDPYTFVRKEDTHIIAPGLNVLKGWDTEKDNTGIFYRPKQTVVLTGDLVVHAIWQEQSEYVAITVIYMAGTWDVVKWGSVDPLFQLAPSKTFRVLEGEMFTFDGDTELEGYTYFGSNLPFSFLVEGPTTLSLWYRRPNMYWNTISPIIGPTQWPPVWPPNYYWTNPYVGGDLRTYWDTKYRKMEDDVWSVRQRRRGSTSYHSNMYGELDEELLPGWDWTLLDGKWITISFYVQTDNGNNDMMMQFDLRKESSTWFQNPPLSIDPNAGLRINGVPINTIQSYHTINNPGNVIFDTSKPVFIEYTYFFHSNSGMSVNTRFPSIQFAARSTEPGPTDPSPIVWKIKIEVGRRATPWEPSPNDIDILPPEPPKPTVNVNINKSVDKSTVVIGETVTYTISVANTWVNATDITVDEILDPSLSLISYNATHGDWDETKWYIGNLNSGVTATLTIIARTTQVKTITNTVTINTPNEINTGKTSDSKTITVTEIPIPEWVEVVGLLWRTTNLNNGTTDYLSYSQMIDTAALQEGRICSQGDLYKLRSQAYYEWDPVLIGGWFADVQSDLKNPEKSLFIPAKGYKMIGSGQIIDEGIWGILRPTLQFGPGDMVSWGLGVSEYGAVGTSVGGHNTISSANAIGMTTRMVKDKPVIVGGLKWDKQNIIVGSTTLFNYANAEVNIPTGKRLATQSEWQTLLSLPSVWDYVLQGLWVADNIGDLQNPDKSLFFPAHGIGGPFGSVLDPEGGNGGYWTSTAAGSSNNVSAKISNVSLLTIDTVGNNKTNHRLSVRCVYYE